MVSEAINLETPKDMQKRIQYMNKPIELKDLKSVIILGTGATRDTCPWDTEVWGVNGAYSMSYDPFLKDKFRMDKLFLTDHLWSTEGTLNFDIDEMNKFAEKYHCEMISLRPIKFGKHKLNVTIYPFKKITKLLATEYFTNTISYMLAYALYLGYQNVKLYGIDMITTLEYQLQKPSVEYFLGYLQGTCIRYRDCANYCGCCVEVPVDPRSSILALPRGAPYGFTKPLDLSVLDPEGLLTKGEE